MQLGKALPLWEKAQESLHRRLGYQDWSSIRSKACEEEGVVPMGAHVNCHHGRAYCLLAAPSEEAVRRAHEKIDLPYNKITEVKRLASLDLLLK